MNQALRIPGPISWVWRVLPSLDQRLRYEEPIRWLQQADGPLLEVGSGTHGITRHLKRTTIGVDFHFGRFDLGYLEPVHGSVLQLPFDEGQFNHVLSVDMLEHIPPDLRLEAIQELIRVAKKRLVLVVPCEGGREADRRLARWLKPFGVPAWLKEHMTFGLPARREVREWLEAALKARQQSYRITEVEGLNANWWFWLALTGHWLPIRLLLHGLLLPFASRLSYWGRRKPAYRVAFLVEWPAA